MALGVTSEDAFIGIGINVGFTDCIVLDCHVLGATFSGIWLSGAHHNLVALNNVDGENVTVTGISIDGDYNRIIGNRVIDGINSGTPPGIQISGGDRNIIEGNTIDDYFDGIELLGGTTKNISRGNTVSNATNIINDAGVNNVDYANV